MDPNNSVIKRLWCIVVLFGAASGEKSEVSEISASKTSLTLKLPNTTQLLSSASSSACDF